MDTLYVAMLIHQECGREVAPLVAQRLLEAGLTPGTCRLVFGDLRTDSAVAEELAAEYGYQLGQPEPTPWDQVEVKPCSLGTRKDGSPYNRAAPAVRNNRLLARCQRACCIYPKGAAFGAVPAAWEALGPDHVALCRVEYETEAM